MRALIRFFFGWYFDQFRPDLIIDSITDLDFEYLRNQLGIWALVLDVDNVLVGGGKDVVPEAIVSHLVGNRVPTVLLSNVIHRTHRRLERLRRIVRQIEAVDYVALGFFWKKPNPWSVAEAMSRFRYTTPEEIGVVDDMLSTGIRAANKYKRWKKVRWPLSVWVRKPIGPQKWHIVIFRRPSERLIVWVLDL
jgi:predicted HAD superfamily phosphohydrolase YqeG